MGKSAHELAMRDPAAAAFYGLTGADFGTEMEEPMLFDGDDTFGSEGVMFGDEAYDGGFSQVDYASEDPNSGWALGESDIGYDANVHFGAEGAAPPGHPGAGHPHQAAHHHGATPQGRAIIAAHLRKQAHRNHRAMLLEPNKYSDLKVERYTFAVTTVITSLGTSAGISGSNSPDVNFRPQRVTANVVSPGMVYITDARVANVSFTVGGMIDAWQWNANGVGQQLDVPTLTPANKASFSANYSGMVPSPLSGTGQYIFSLAFTGPASIVA
jgi:hypothetical protein